MVSAERPARPRRVLFLVHRYHDDGANGLALRMNAFVRNLDRTRIEPYLMTVNATERRLDVLDALYAGHVDERLQERPHEGLRKVFDRLTLSPWLLYREYPTLREVLLARCRAWGIDMVLETGGFLVSNLDPAWLPVAMACDLIDSPLVGLRRELATATDPLERARLSYRIAAARRYQARCLGRTRFVAVTAEADADEVRATTPGTPLLLIKNGVDTDFFSPGAGLPDAPDLVFEGGMSYAPNVDAARFLVEDILPRVRARHPGVRTWLVGKDPAPEVTALAGPAVRVTGTVDDVRPYVRGARVFVCPMRLGAGIKNKILQAWSMGVPVVATSASLPGLAADPDRHLLVADTAQAFADAVCRLLDDRAKAQALAAAALAHVRAQFSWQQRSMALTEAIERVLDGQAPDAGLRSAA